MDCAIPFLNRNRLDNSNKKRKKAIIPQRVKLGKHVSKHFINWNLIPYLPMRFAVLTLLFCFTLTFSAYSQSRPRDLGITIGILPVGENNAITDVPGVKVGHLTKTDGNNIRTGVTAILPHGGNIFQQKVPAAIYVGNGFGKLAGSTQVQELGNIESPIILTNTLSLAAGIEGAVRYSLEQKGNENAQSVNAVVGETNDGYLNDIRGMHISSEEVIQAIMSAESGTVAEGNVGSGTVGEKLGKYPFRDAMEKSDGSCMIVVATDAPVLDRNLERMAMRAMMGLAKTGGIASNGSGDYVIAFSTAEGLRIPYVLEAQTLEKAEFIQNDDMSSLFMAVIEATEEAIINSLFAAETMTGKDGHTVAKLPVEQVMNWMK